MIIVDGVLKTLKENARFIRNKTHLVFYQSKLFIPKLSTSVHLNTTEYFHDITWEFS